MDLILALFDRRSEARRRQTPANHVQSTADRFKYLVEAHGLKLAQIPGLLPYELSVRLAQFKDDESIVETLTPDFLAWVAGVFGVQRAWLECGTDNIYAPACPAYKNMDRFVAWLQESGWWTDQLTMLVFTSERDLSKPGAAGLLAISMARPIQIVPDSDVLQFLPIDDEWDWGQPPSRQSVLQRAERVLGRFSVPIRVYRVP